MKRTSALILAAITALAVFATLVHLVLVAAQVSEPAATTITGLTLRRLWATIVAVIAMASAVMGVIALARAASRFGARSLKAIVVAGRIGKSAANFPAFSLTLSAIV